MTVSKKEALDRERSYLMDKYAWVDLHQVASEAQGDNFEVFLYENNVPYRRQGLTFQTPKPVYPESIKVVEAQLQGRFESIHGSEDPMAISNPYDSYEPKVHPSPRMPVGMYARFLIILFILMGLLRMLFVLGYLDF